MARIATLKNLIQIVFVFGTFTAYAEVRRDDDYVWRRARTLNSGQKVFSFQASYQNFAQKFSDDGRAQALGQVYSRPLTWKRLLDANVSARAEIKDYLEKNNLREDEVAATSSYDITRQEIGFGLNWAYGLTESWMVGILVPIRFVTVRAKETITPSSKLTPAMRERLPQLAATELADSGYDQVPMQRQAWEFGDVTLLNQLEIMRKYSWTWGFQQQVRFPTARSPSITEYISSAEDRGSVNLGLTSLLDYQWKKAVAGFRAGYVAQLPDSVRMRAPSAGNAAVDPRVNRDLGDWVWGAVDTEVRLTRKFGVSAEHAFLAKSRDRYSGEAFNTDVYQQMAEQSDQQLQQSRLGMLYRIGSGTRTGERWMASVDYTYPWIGKNSTDAARTSFELINYF